MKENIPIQMGATVQDITKTRKAGESLINIENVRRKEIHHRIKNNLQVISSLLDLQAEKFKNRKDIMDSEVLDAFRGIQHRVISMALIHEELYEGNDGDAVGFSSYLGKLVENIFMTYRLGNTDISLKMDMEENFFFDMNTAVPLGMIINELFSNSLKHAFFGRAKGEIQIKLRRKGNKKDRCKSTSFTLDVSDNGIGIPENFEIESLNSLGFQLVASLVDQLDGEFVLKRDNGMKFTMRFVVIEK
jgi:two-component sensor histidine kinase